MVARISPETVRHAEEGHHQPSARVLAAVARALSVPVVELVPEPPTLGALRRRLGRTQRETGAMIGVSAGMVGRVEAGVYGVSAPAVWAAAYGVPVEEWQRVHAAGREARRRAIIKDHGGRL